MLDDLEEMGLPPIDEISGISPNELDSIVNALASGDVTATHAAAPSARPTSDVTAAPTATITAPPHDSIADAQPHTSPTPPVTLHLPVTSAAPPLHSVRFHPSVLLRQSHQNNTHARTRALPAAYTSRLICKLTTATFGQPRQPSTAHSSVTPWKWLPGAPPKIARSRTHSRSGIPLWTVRRRSRCWNATRRTRRHFNQQASTSETIQLDTDDALYITTDEAFALAARTPYNMTVELPPSLTSQTSDALYFQARGTNDVPDAERHYPTATNTRSHTA